MIIALITPFGRQQKNLIGLTCRSPQSRKEMQNEPETMNKKPNDLQNT